MEGLTGKRHRLHAICPYFAMFPPEFVRRHVEAHTRKGDLVLDPFSGRGTTLLESLLLGRNAIACDINPVAYCITASKARIPSEETLLRTIEQLETGYKQSGTRRSRLLELPRFFSYAFTPDTLTQLLFLRSALDWKGNFVHRFITALILGHLHGESDRSIYYFSNQMPHSISTKPEYSIRYWRRHRLEAPRRNVFEILKNRALFRLEEGKPERTATAALCDVRQADKVFRDYSGRVRAVITSPPYLDVTNFEEDQWLRLWFLGGPPRPTYRKVSRDDRYSGADKYWRFIEAAWHGIAPLLRKNAVLVCRISARGVSRGELSSRFCEVIHSIWPRAKMIGKPYESELRRSQMSVLNPTAHGCRYELDYSVSLN